MRTIHHHLIAAGAALAMAIPATAILLPATAEAQISIGLSIRIGYAPPPIPVYVPPPLPAPGLIWVPGHWRWSDWIDDYYWVSGYWERPPQFGLLWTPAWWGWDNGAFLYHEGYWGREVGWYGGIDYGFGYHGHGWVGGRWVNGQLAYNSAVVNFGGVHVTNVYNERVTVINNGPRVSYAGGAGGVQAQPTPAELRATQAPHIAPTAAQQQRFAQAASNPRARFGNHAELVTAGGPSRQRDGHTNPARGCAETGRHHRRCAAAISAPGGGCPGPPGNRGSASLSPGAGGTCLSPGPGGDTGIPPGTCRTGLSSGACASPGCSPRPGQSSGPGAQTGRPAPAAARTRTPVSIAAGAPHRAPLPAFLACNTLDHVRAAPDGGNPATGDAA